jgi:hypothetical protein
VRQILSKSQQTQFRKGKIEEELDKKGQDEVGTRKQELRKIQHIRYSGIMRGK